MAPIKHYLNTTLRDKVVNLMKSMDCKHENDDDIKRYPMILQNYLNHIGYIVYDVTDTGIRYKWADGALDLLNETILAEPPRKEPEKIEACIRGDYDIDLILEIGATSNPQMITVLPTARCGTLSKGFSRYDIFLNDADERGIYSLQARDRYRNETKTIATIIDEEERKFPDTTERTFWEKADDKTFVCERLGVTVKLRDTLINGGHTALTVDISTMNVNGSTDGTFLALISDKMDGPATGIVRFAEVRYMLNGKNPILNMYESRCTF